jgi:hypothetical protein
MKARGLPPSSGRGVPGFLYRFEAAVLLNKFRLPFNVKAGLVQ